MPIKKRNDRFDLSPQEILLIRVGHHLWNKRRKALKASDLREVGILDASLESVWAAKRQYRTERDLRRAAESERLNGCFGRRQATERILKAA
jgi:hypothetical protein